VYTAWATELEFCTGSIMCSRQWKICKDAQGVYQKYLVHQGVLNEDGTEYIGPNTCPSHGEEFIGPDGVVDGIGVLAGQQFTWLFGYCNDNSANCESTCF
jgi:hypothetical protein